MSKQVKKSLQGVFNNDFLGDGSAEHWLPIPI